MQLHHRAGGRNPWLLHNFFSHIFKCYFYKHKEQKLSQLAVRRSARRKARPIQFPGFYPLSVF